MTNEEDTIDITLWAATKRVGSKDSITVTVDRGEWEDMPESERHESMLKEFWNQGLVDWGFSEEEVTE